MDAHRVRGARWRENREGGEVEVAGGRWPWHATTAMSTAQLEIWRSCGEGIMMPAYSLEIPLADLERVSTAL